MTPGGPTVILNGTAQEVYAQLLNLNPNYEAQLGTIDQKAAASAITRRSALLHRKRQHQVVGPYWDGDWKCGYGDKGADIGAIRVGVHYLRGLNGRPANGPGPGNCGRVSCSYNSAIWWCNDVSANDQCVFFLFIGCSLFLSSLVSACWLDKARFQLCAFLHSLAGHVNARG